ncbi:hypothetical protein ACLSNP_002495 [Enterococcus faecalis]
MKKIMFMLMLISFSITFMLFNDAEFFKMDGYPNRKIISTTEAYKKNEDQYSLYSNLIKIERKNNVSIVKFDSLKKDNNIYYEFNSVGESHLEPQKFFNKKIYTSYLSRKVEDKDITGIYYFSNFNSSIEKEIANLGLIAIDNQNISTAKKILLIIYDSYIYLLILTLLIYTIKISYKRSQEDSNRQRSDSLQLLTKKNVFLLSGIQAVILGVLWIYNGWNNLVEFLYYYGMLFVFGCALFSVIYVIFSRILQTKGIIKLTRKFNVQLFLFTQTIVLLLLYIVFSAFVPVAYEIYLSYIKNPISVVSNYSTVDLTSFSPEFYFGTKKIEKDYKDFLMNHEDIILSAYNVGYDFNQQNYDPYSGNSLLVSPSYFNKSKIKSKEGPVFEVESFEKRADATIIIPFKQRGNIDKIKKAYTEWLNFLTNIPLEEISMNVLYSQDDQNIYSYAYQNSINDLKLKSPAILVVDPYKLTNEQIRSFMTNRFFVFKNEKNPSNGEIYQSYFAEMSKIKILVENGSVIWLIRGIVLLISLCLLLVIEITKKVSKFSLIDTLIWNVITLTVIKLIFPIEKIPYIIIVLLMIYLCVIRAKNFDQQLEK